MNMTKRILGKWLHRNGIEMHRRAGTSASRYMAILNTGKQLHLYIMSNGYCYAEIVDSDNQTIDWAPYLSNVCKLIKLHNTN